MLVGRGSLFPEIISPHRRSSALAAGRAAAVLDYFDAAFALPATVSGQPRPPAIKPVTKPAGAARAAAGGPVAARGTGTRSATRRRRQRHRRLQLPELGSPLQTPPSDGTVPPPGTPASPAAAAAAAAEDLAASHALERYFPGPGSTTATHSHVGEARRQADLARRAPPPAPTASEIRAAAKGDMATCYLCNTEIEVACVSTGRRRRRLVCSGCTAAMGFDHDAPAPAPRRRRRQPGAPAGSAAAAAVPCTEESPLSPVLRKITTRAVDRRARGDHAPRPARAAGVQAPAKSRRRRGVAVQRRRQVTRADSELPPIRTRATAVVVKVH